MFEIKICARSALGAIVIPVSAFGDSVSWGTTYKAVGSHMPKKAENMPNERSRAFDIRASWMRKMGFCEEEIAEACIDDGSPINLGEEQEQLEAASRIKARRLSGNDLLELARKHTPPNAYWND